MRRATRSCGERCESVRPPGRDATLDAVRWPVGTGKPSTGTAVRLNADYPAYPATIRNCSTNRGRRMIGGEGSALRAIEQGIGEREGWLQIAQALRRDHDGTAGDLTGEQLRAYVVEDTEPAGDLLGVAAHAARVRVVEDSSGVARTFAWHGNGVFTSGGDPSRRRRRAARGKVRSSGCAPRDGGGSARTRRPGPASGRIGTACASGWGLSLSLIVEVRKTRSG